MPIIPDLKPLDGEHRPAAPSVSAAMAPGLGLQNLGEGISKAGDDIGEIVLRRQKEADDSALNQAEIDMQLAQDDIAAYQLKNPDEATWENYAATRTAQAREKSSKLKLTPDGRQRLDQQFDQWQQRTTSGTRNAGLLNERTRRRQVAVDLSEVHLKSGRFDQALEAYNRGPFHPDEKAAFAGEVEYYRDKWNKDAARDARLAAINANPFGTAAEYKSPTAPEGVEQSEYTLARNHSQQAVMNEQNQLLDTIRDKQAAGLITRPDQLEEYKDELGEYAVKDLQNRMDRVLKEYEKLFLDSPAGQQQLHGRIAYNIKHLERGDTRGRIAIQGMLDDLKDIGQKNDLTSELADRVSGTVKPLTPASEAFKALDEYDERLARKLPQAQRMTTHQIVKKGFFKDEAKMISLGFSEAQARQIRQSAERSNGEGQAMFRQLWDWRPSGSVDAERTAVLAAEALRNDSPTIDVFTTESEAAARAAEEEFYRGKGERRIKLAGFLQAHPKATVTEIQTKIRELADGQASASLKEKVIPARPVRPTRPVPAGSGPKGAADSTSTSPVGKDLISIVKNFEAGGAPGGFHAEAYEDYDQWSIGYGTRSRKGETIDEAEATRRLETELASHRERVEKEAKRVGMTFTANEMDALTSFDFNTGSIGKLLAGGTRSKAEIAEKMLQYRYADGKVLRGLENRRKAEQELFLR